MRCSANHVIERFERADLETNQQRKAQLLTFVVIGGGLVGVELLGELTAFVDGIAPCMRTSIATQSGLSYSKAAHI